MLAKPFEKNPKDTFIYWKWQGTTYHKVNQINRPQMNLIRSKNYYKNRLAYFNGQNDIIKYHGLSLPNALTNWIIAHNINAWKTEKQTRTIGTGFQNITIFLGYFF